jgi:PadR family transcriptional regulator PadR
LCRSPTQPYSSLSTQHMADKARIELLPGTLDLLILRTLAFGPSHGHAIARQIRRTSDDVLQVETGSLYPALHRLETQGWISSVWQLSDKGKRAKYYRLTRSGRKQLAGEQSKWEQLAIAMARVLRPAQ